MSFPRFIVSFAAAASSASAVHSQTLVQVDQPSTPGAVTLIYEPENGNLSLDTGGELLDTIQITSQKGMLTGMPSSYSIHTDDCVGGFFTAKGDLFCAQGDSESFLVSGGFDGVSAFGDLDFETISEPDLAAEFLLTDLTVWAVVTGDGLAINPQLLVVPEPSSMLLCLSGFLGLLAVGTPGKSSRRTSSMAANTA